MTPLTVKRQAIISATLSPLRRFSVAQRGCRLEKWKQAHCCAGSLRSKLEHGLLWSMCQPRIPWFSQVMPGLKRDCNFNRNSGIVHPTNFSICSLLQAFARFTAARHRALRLFLRRRFGSHLMCFQQSSAFFLFRLIIERYRSSISCLR